MDELTCGIQVAPNSYNYWKIAFITLFTGISMFFVLVVITYRRAEARKKKLVQALDNGLNEGLTCLRKAAEEEIPNFKLPPVADVDKPSDRANILEQVRRFRQMMESMGMRGETLCRYYKQTFLNGVCLNAYKQHPGLKEELVAEYESLGGVWEEPEERTNEEALRDMFVKPLQQLQKSLEENIP